jgi:alpha-tubulin suppressor-like RCC1 family protein/endonuclease/exonuclease/phosphatase family metal-dependent hydrolase
VNARAAALLTTLVVALGFLVAFQTSSSGAKAPRRVAVAAHHRVAVPSPVTQLSAGGQHGCAISTAHTLSCWGDDTYGQLSGPVRGAATTPLAVGAARNWAQVSAGGSHTCGVTTRHRVLCWGLNRFGGLGNGKTKATSARVKVAHGTRYASVAAGWFQTCGIRTSHVMFCWGDNRSGELGNGGHATAKRPHKVAGRQGWSQVSTGGWSTCGIKLDGSLWCWGGNQWGQLGIGSTSNTSRPARVGSRSDWSAVSASWSHTCAITRGGEAWCWGNNTQGQLGNGTRTASTVPVRVATSAVARQIAAGEGTSCLLDASGRVLCWGDNGYGQVGDAHALTHAVPVVRSTGVKAISAGWLDTCDLKSGGAVVCYGNNEYGQLGNGTYTDTAYQTAPRAAARDAVASTTASPNSTATDLPTVLPTALPTPTTTPTPAPTSYTMSPGAATSLRIGTFNVLGNEHTVPGSDEDYRAPARLRAEWTAQALDVLGLDVVGTQEAQAQQLGWILKATHGEFASYGTPDQGNRWTEAALLWRTSAFTAVQTKRLITPYLKVPMPRPLVLLQSRTTGRQMWVLDVHNAPWKSRAQQRKRTQGVTAQVTKLQRLTKQGYPVFYLGDFNEKSRAFCQVIENTSLRSPQGGRVTRAGVCKPPRNQRVDWIFGSNGTAWSGYEQTRTPLVGNATDHWVQLASAYLP